MYRYILLSMLMCTVPLSAQGKKMETKYNFNKIPEYIDSQMQKGEFPGASIIVQHKGKVVYRQSWGTYCSRTDRNVALTDDVVHMMYSVSKGISATVIVIAHQKGLIDYDVPLSTYIPEYKGKDKDTCTIRKLLTHSAGIPNCPLGAVDTPESWQKALETCCEYKVEWEPGSRTAYHGTQGVFLAAEAVRRVSGLPTWEAVCRKFLFDPIGATSLTFTVPKGSAVALTPQPASLPVELNSGAYGMLGHPGAGCFGKVEDVLKVLDINLHKGKYKGKQIIDPKELKEMHSVQYEKQIAAAEAAGKSAVHEPWGLGWLIKRNLKDHWFGLGTNTDPKTFGHAGIDTVLTVAEPKRDFALVFLTTNSPIDTVNIRNKVTDLVTEAIDNSTK